MQSVDQGPFASTRVRRYIGADAEELSNALSTSISPILVEAASPKSISFQCDFVSAGSISLGLCSYEGRFKLSRQADCGKFIVFLPLHGGANVSMKKQHYCSSPSRALIHDGEPNGDFSVNGPLQHLVVMLDRTMIINHLSSLLEIPIHGRLDFFPEIDLTSGPGQLLRSLAELTFQGLARDATLGFAPLTQSNIISAMTNLVLETVPHRYSDKLTKAVTAPMPRYVKRAMDFMQANLSQPISIIDIASASHVSVRSLQRGFRDFRMITPMEYLWNLRLHAAHNDLLNRDLAITVAAAAKKWGFTHLGRFSREYKNAFGCLPSYTLKIEDRPGRLHRADAGINASKE